MNITISNFRGLEHAAITCAPIALLAGPNGSGKSSLAQAVAAALTGNALAPTFELNKKDAKELVRRGAQEARAGISSKGGNITMVWPGCELGSTGADAPRATVFAAGLASIPLLPIKERAAALEPYLNAAPTLDDLKLAMAETFHPSAPDRLWGEIQKQGWDKTAQDYETARRDAGRDWSKLTGENFGSDKASRWRPAGWREELAQADMAELDLHLREARETLERTIAEAAVDAADIQRVREAAAGAGSAAQSLKDADKAYTAADAAVKAAREKRDKLPAPVSGSGMPCPHCNQPIQFQRKGPETTLIKFEPLPDPENKKRREAIAAADGEVSRLEAACSAASRIHEDAQAALAVAKRAGERLGTLQARTGSADQVTAARETVTRLESDVAALGKFAETRDAYRTWRSADLKLAILVPSGLRAKKLGQVIGAFNSAALAPLCEIAGWPLVNITEELAVRLGERPYPLLSESEKFRVRATLQVAMAMQPCDKSSMVVIDGADILDTAGRNGLFAMLANAGIPALVAMTSVRGATVPDLAKHGMGATYVLENNRARSLAQEQEAA